MKDTHFDALITGILARFASSAGAAIDHQIDICLRDIALFANAEAAFIVLDAPNNHLWDMQYLWQSPRSPRRFKPSQKIYCEECPWYASQLAAGRTTQIGSAADFPAEAALERQRFERDGLKSALILPLRGRARLVTGAFGLYSYTKPVEWSPHSVHRLSVIADALVNVLVRRQMEHRWQVSRQMLRQILNTIPQRVFWKDKNLRYLGCNEAFAAELGLPSTAVVGRTDFELPWSINAEWMQAEDAFVLNGETEIGAEKSFLDASGKEHWLRVNKVPLRHPDRSIFGMLGTYEDVSDLRQARENYRQAKEAAEAANQAKDQFIAVLSHELRTPLTPVLALLTSLMESPEFLGKLSPDIAGELREDLALMHRNVELEARLIDDLLDVTRISQGKIMLRQEVVDVHACLASVLEICERDMEAKRLSVVLKRNAGRHFAWADSARLRQVLWNLLKNAIKFTPPDGRIFITTSNDANPQNEKGRLKVEIRDTGIGIAPEALGRIFRAFEQGEQTRTRQFGGLGLGLSIARTLVEMHGGQLTAQSDGQGKGAAFTVELETVAAPQAVREAPLAHPATPLGSQRILLVEDHPDTRRILARLLAKWGYNVTTADSVAGAIEAGKRGRFDLLVSDLGLPDGSGLDVRQALKLKAVALSGYGTDGDVKDSLEAGFAEHLIKPVSFQTLRDVVQKLLERT